MPKPMRYIIYAPESGTIRAVMRGSRVTAEMNVRAGEALAEHAGFVTHETHRIAGGRVVDLPPPPPPVVVQPTDKNNKPNQPNKNKP